MARSTTVTAVSVTGMTECHSVPVVVTVAVQCCSNEWHDMQYYCHCSVSVTGMTECHSVPVVVTVAVQCCSNEWHGMQDNCSVTDNA